MDVLLLEALRVNNPFTAKHGTRLQMWQNIAETVGMAVFKNPGAYSDRVTALMKMYTDGKHDKLFKHGTMEENARKEVILREVNAALARKNNKLVARPVTDANSKDRTPATKATGPQKRRKLDAGVGAGGKAAAAAGVQDAGSDQFRARVLELIESKIQFDMEQRVKETELREQEFELQKRFLEYLQSK
ncbi:hypothetical protein BBJ28_00019144 [Nothophytophthora sp. Chile5]|nr:hypothetical protein BBJ28_00019144 [Nothophytophthora sp. Chile5]